MTNSIVLVTNEINPYRKSFYDGLYKYCESIGIKFTVLLMTKVEHGYNWDYEKVKSDYAILMKGKHFSFPISNYLNWEVLGDLKNLKPDIVIVAGSYFYYTNWMVIAQRHKLNYPVYFWSETHLQEARAYNSFLLKIREVIRRILYSKFDGFWFSGKLSRQLIERYARKDAKYHFVPNLIDHTTYLNTSASLRNQRAELRAKWNIPLDNEVLITPARLSWVKGIHTFLDLLNEAALRHKVTMLIPGTGDFKDEIELKIKETGLDVRLLGYQQQDSVIELYSLSDFFVLPSLSDPNPLTCIEALWCGLPLLVSMHVGNYPEVIQECQNGYVFDYANKTDAVEKIDKLLSSSAEWRKSAADCSLQLANKYYNPNNVIKRLVDDMVRENS